MLITRAELAAELPKDRPYTRLEALFSLSLFAGRITDVQVNEYAAVWRWPRERVKAFLEEIKGRV